MLDHSGDDALRVTRTLPAPPVAVWTALTDPTALAGWFWPARLNPTAWTDPRPGGEFRIAADTIAVGGTYAAFDPPHRLAFTWKWDSDDAETLVTIELSAVDGGTELTLVHERFSDVADRDNHVTGWVDCLARLEPYLKVASSS